MGEIEAAEGACFVQDTPKAHDSWRQIRLLRHIYFCRRTKCSANRKASATAVKVGLAKPEVGKIAVPAANVRGRNVLWGFIALLAALQVYANFGPPPSSETMMAMMALSFYGVLAAMAAWVERVRTA